MSTNKQHFFFLPAEILDWTRYLHTSVLQNSIYKFHPYFLLCVASALTIQYTTHSLSLNLRRIWTTQMAPTHQQTGTWLGPVVCKERLICLDASRRLDKHDNCPPSSYPLHINCARGRASERLKNTQLGSRLRCTCTTQF